jgi:Fic family protein
MPNNPTRPNGDVHEYCPPEQVQSEMEGLIDLHRRHAESEMPPELESAWLHHRFTEVHTFQDGNGRVARALSSLIFLRAGWFPLVVHRDIRGDYLDCLEAADADDLEPLIQLFTKIKKQSFLRALNTSEEVLRGREPVRQVIAAAAK